MEHRKRRLKLNRASVHADLLKERCVDSGLSYEHIMQADFVLYIVDAVKALKGNRMQEWYPYSLVFETYHISAFEVFLRSESTQYFNDFRGVLGVEVKAELEQVIEAIETEKLYVPKWSYDRVYPEILMNLENMCTQE